MTLDWEEDAVSSEAARSVDDSYYQGSEDEGYAADTRRLRCEAAGQRYLDGHAPFLLSASLRGPFDQASGWANPWRSKQRTASLKNLPFVSGPKPRHTTTEPFAPAQRSPAMDSLECHLPSPESLKQAHVTEPHLYLKKNELSMVQRWRKDVRASSCSQDSFCVSSAAQMDASSAKREAEESPWLKRLANKKRKMDSGGPSFHRSTFVQRHSKFRFSPKGKLRGSGCISSVLASPRRSASRPFFSSQMSRSAHQWHISEDGDQDERDELSIATPDSSSGSASERHISITRRVSPRRDVCRSAGLHNRDSGDELNQTEAVQNEVLAAVTLSSPVSQAFADPTTGSSNVESVTQGPAAFVAAARGEVQDNVDMTDNDEQHDSMMQDENCALVSNTYTRDFQTQYDRSFHYRMRQKTKAGAEDGIASQLDDRPDQQPASASIDGALLPISPSSNPLDDLDGIESIQAVSEADWAAGAICDVGDAGKKVTSNDLGMRQVQRTHQHSDAGRKIQMQPSCRLSPGSHTTVTDHAPENTHKLDQQSSQIVPAAELVRDSLLSAAEPETELYSSRQPSVIGASQEPDHAGRELVSECSYDNEAVDQIAEKQKVDSASRFGHAMLAATEVQQTVHVDPAAELIPAGRDSVAAEETEAVGPAGQCQVRREEEPICLTDKDTNDFSIKNILNHLIPSSPWARLSQLTTRSASSPAPQSKTDKAADENPTSMVVREGVASLHTRFVADPATMPAVESKGEEKGAADAAVFYNAVPDSMGSPEKHDSVRITESQQSPWTKTQLSQQVVLPLATISGGDTQDSPCGSAGCYNESQRTVPAGAQSPWSHGAETCIKAGIRSAPAAHGILCDEEDDSYSQNGQTLQSAVSQSTPEPQFVVKSFASFMSPSPDRSRRHMGWTRKSSSGGCLPSSMRNSWSSSRTNRRVSWASMPQNLESHASTPLSLRKSVRQGSPPPTTLIADLPTSEGSKFGKHFAAVASRTDGLRQKLIPTASQQALQSPGLQGMADKFLAADMAVNDKAGTDDIRQQSEEVEASEDLAERESQEPREVAEIMLQEMGDLLQVWDVEAELERERRVALAGTLQPSVTKQSLW